MLGFPSKTLSLPTLHRTPAAPPPHLPDMLASPVRYHAAPREHLGALPQVLRPVGDAGKHRPKSTASSCCDDGEWQRSASPAPSTHSGHSSPSEVTDSGVCSEHDTPPPLTRHPTRPRHLRLHTSSDSDSESNVSCDSLTESHRGQTKYQWASSCRSSCSRRSTRTFPAPPTKASLPESLLNEIREKWQELQQRRQLQQQARVEVPDRAQHVPRAGAQWARHHRYSCPASPSLSCTSSNFPSSLSLFEEEVEWWRGSSPPQEGWRGGSSPPQEDDTRSLYECRDVNAGQGFAGIRDIFSPQQESTIKSYKGTVRGVKNRVRAGIATFTSDQRITKHFMERERGKVVVYVTTLGIVRDTYERCLRLRKILWTLLVRFEERDVFMARDTQLQLLDRLRVGSVTVPHLFIEGQYLGDAEQIERMNECGELRRLLQPYRRATSCTPCDTCGGFRLLPCSVCNGSKKSVHRNDFTLEFVALKCSSCDESGLVKCMDCAEYKDDFEEEQV